MADLEHETKQTVRLWWFPPALWLAEYRAAWLPGDIVAGITLAAYAIPVSLAYAGLAGLPNNPRLKETVAHTVSNASVVNSCGTSPISERAAR